jgi:superfamily II DNA/RNA helicase
LGRIAAFPGCPARHHPALLLIPIFARTKFQLVDFTEFGLDEKLMEGIASLNYKTATPAQEKAIPIILQGKDIIVSAQTGTGKTAAYLLPIINKIIQEHANQHNIKALVLVPTRELAVQIDQLMEGLSYFTDVSSIAVYGGGDGLSFSREQQALTRGADIVICTPGRMLAHLNMGYFKFDGLKYLVLDEADRMLDIGFFDDIMRIISYLPKQRQNLLFSATMPHKIRELARKVLHEPEEINIAISKPNERIVQEVYMVTESQKIPLVKHILEGRTGQRILIFCSTKSSTKQLARELKRAGMPVEDIHSDLEQNEREEVLLAFKNRKVETLVATDILSRGIDIEDIDLVINYDVPNDGEDYIHRIGRTARAASTGKAITFVNEKEQFRFSKIEDLLGREVPRMILPEHLGVSPEYNPVKNRKLGQKRHGGGGGGGRHRSGGGGGQHRGGKKRGGGHHSGGGGHHHKPKP